MRDAVLAAVEILQGILLASGGGIEREDQPPIPPDPCVIAGLK